MVRTPRRQSWTLSVILGSWLMLSQPLYAQIPWTQDYDAAQVASRNTGAVMLLHFYSNDCVPCKMLDVRAFQDPTLINAMKQTVIPVKINVDNHPQLAKKYSVNRWPTDVYLAGDGTELARTISPQKTSDYVTLLERVALRNRDHLVVAQAGEQPRRDLAVHREPPQPANTFDQRVRSQNTFAQNTVTQTTNGQTLDSAGYLPPLPPQLASQPTLQAPSALAPTSSLMTSALGQSAFPEPNAAPAFALPPQNFASNAPSSVPQANLPSPAHLSSPAALASIPTHTFATSQPNMVANAQRSPANPAATAATASPSATMTLASNQSVVENTFLTQQPATNATSQPDSSRPAADVAASARLVSQPATENRGVLTVDTGIASPLANNQAANATEAVQQRIAQEVTSATERNLTPAMSGFCPVTLDEKSVWKLGNPAFAVRHRGRVFHFANAEYQQKFLQTPDRYAPILSGYDLVHFLHNGELRDGLREYGCWFKGRVYLFSSAANREFFDENVIEVASAAESLQSKGQTATPSAPESNSGRSPSPAPAFDPSQGRIADGIHGAEIAR